MKMEKRQPLQGKSLREFVLDIEDIESEEVTVKQWGNRKFLVKSMTGEERDKMFKASMDDKGEKIDSEKLTVNIIIFTTRDPHTKELIFRPEDIAILKKKNAAALEKLSAVASRLSGIGEEAVTEKAKNSEAAIQSE